MQTRGVPGMFFMLEYLLGCGTPKERKHCRTMYCGVQVLLFEHRRMILQPRYHLLITVNTPK
jgi:hypothetical protein